MKSHTIYTMEQVIEEKKNYNAFIPKLVQKLVPKFPKRKLCFAFKFVPVRNTNVKNLDFACKLVLACPCLFL